MADLALVNEALVRIGVPPVASLNDAGAQALTVSTIYDRVVSELLADHPWSFALREKLLAKLVLPEGDERFTGYEHVYQLPAGYIRVLGLQSHDWFQISGDQLYTRDNAARLVYVDNAGPSLWSPHFKGLVVTALAAAFAISLTDSSARADVFYREQELQKRRARMIDSQQTPPQVINLMRIYTRRTSNPLSQA